MNTFKEAMNVAFPNVIEINNEHATSGFFTLQSETSVGTSDLKRCIGSYFESLGVDTEKISLREDTMGASGVAMSPQGLITITVSYADFTHQVLDVGVNYG